MRNILLVVAHPILEKSRNNIRLVKAAESLDFVTIRDLYELYPRFSINTKKEQEYLEQHDLIILQHPFYWYGTPALLKQYFDMVFVHGWAYGKDAAKLEGKLMFNSLTTSGSRESYHPDGSNRFPLNAYLTPISQLAAVCKMHYLPPFVLHQSGKAAAVNSDEHARNFASLLNTLHQENADIDKIRRMEYLNDIF